MKQFPIYLTILVLLLSACGPAEQQVTPSPTSTNPPTPSRTAIPTDTPRPEPTPTPTATPSPTPTASPGPDFSKAEISSVAHLEDKRLMITFLVPGGVEGVYDAYIGRTYLPCETPYQYPGRIICVGPEPYVNYSPEGALVELYGLYADLEAPPLFEGFITIPPRPTPTATEPISFPDEFEIPGPGFPGFP